MRKAGRLINYKTRLFVHILKKKKMKSDRAEERGVQKTDKIVLIFVFRVHLYDQDDAHIFGMGLLKRGARATRPHIQIGHLFTCCLLVVQ